MHLSLTLSLSFSPSMVLQRCGWGLINVGDSDFGFMASDLAEIGSWNFVGFYREGGLGFWIRKMGFGGQWVFIIYRLIFCLHMISKLLVVKISYKICSVTGCENLLPNLYFKRTYFSV